MIHKLPFLSLYALRLCCIFVMWSGGKAHTTKGKRLKATFANSNLTCSWDYNLLVVGRPGNNFCQDGLQLLRLKPFNYKIKKVRICSPHLRIGRYSWDYTQSVVRLQFVKVMYVFSDWLWGEDSPLMLFSKISDLFFSKELLILDMFMGL